MRNIATVLLLLVGAAFPLVVGYHLDPVKAQWSGWTPSEFPNNYVSEVLTVNFDEPITASLFCGSPGAGGDYNVSILTYPGGFEIASGDTIDPGDHRWATCTLEVLEPDSFIKGRQVEVRWTRGGSDSIQYYTNVGQTYPYGFMRVGGGGGA